MRQAGESLCLEFDQVQEIQSLLFCITHLFYVRVIQQNNNNKVFYVRYYVLGLLRARNCQLKPFYARVIQLRNVLIRSIT